MRSRKRKSLRLTRIIRGHEFMVELCVDKPQDTEPSGGKGFSESSSRIEIEFFTSSLCVATVSQKPLEASLEGDKENRNRYSLIFLKS